MLDFGFYNMDCMEGMKQFPDKYFDLAIVDPPYRNSFENAPTKDMRRNGTLSNFGDKPNIEYFNELWRVSKNQIIWGANNFSLILPPYKGFIVWVKKTISDNFTMSMAEIAALSENLGTTSKCFLYAPQDTRKDPRIHPTQKPIELYTWILNKYAKKDDIILDTHVGSASSLIACHRTNHKFVGFELDEYYYKLASQRLKDEISRTKLF